MRFRPLSAASAALAVAGALAVPLVVPSGAQAAPSTPPGWLPTAQAVGTVTFYNASGAVITSGRTDTAPFAAYAVGSGVPHKGDTQAGILFANPDASSTPANWYVETAGLLTHQPVKSGPSDVTSLGKTHPVVAGGSGDQTLDGFESDSIPSTTAGYAGIVHIRLVTATTQGAKSAGYDEAAVSIDPATHTWTQVYPTPGSTPDTTAFSISAPSSVTYGEKAKVTGTLTDTTASTAVGGAAVALYGRTSSSAKWAKLASATTSSSGAAKVSVTLPRSEQVQWRYAGAAGSPGTGAATSKTTTISVSPALTAAATPTKVKHGKTVKVYGTAAPAKGTVVLQELSGKTWKSTKITAKIAKQKLPNGKKAYGFVLPVALAKKGTYSLRAYEKAASGLAAGYSNAVKVKVS